VPFRELRVSDLNLFPFVFIVVKTKNPTAVRQWGSINLVNKSKPNRAIRQQRTRKQQVQITIHSWNVARAQRNRQIIFPTARFSRGKFLAGQSEFQIVARQRVNSAL
jgi:hypothetical protein